MAINFDKVWGAWEEVVWETSPRLTKVIAYINNDGYLSGVTGVKVLVKGPLPDDGKTFTLENPRAVDWFSREGGTVDKIRGIQETTGNLIKTQVTDALTKGKSYGELATQIKETFTDMKRTRAERIAVTEIGNAYEAGNYNTAKEIEDLGVPMLKQWNTSQDDKVDDECMANEAEGPIPIDQPHQSGHMEPLAHPNCRCYETYMMAEE